MSHNQRRFCLCGVLLVFLISGLGKGTPARLTETSMVQEAGGQTTASFDQAQALAALRKQIAGKEELPAEQVFKNIQIFKGMPAGRLLRVMELGYSRSQGVNCTHCHVAEQWEKE